MSFAIVASLANEVLPLVRAAVDKSTVLVTWVVPFFLIGITLKIMFHGFEVMRGAGGGQVFLDLIAKLAKPVLVLNLALAGGMYSMTVVGFFLELRSDLVGLFGKSGNSYAALDTALGQAATVIQAGVGSAMSSVSFTDLTGLVTTACLGVIGFCFCVYAILAAVNLLIIDASLLIIFGFGPLFVACLAWQTTARFFDSWMSAVLKYTFTAVIMSVVIGIANQLVVKFVSKMTASPELDTVLMNTLAAFVGLGLIAALVLKVGTLAADLVGGVGFSLSGVAKADKAISMGASGASSAAGYAGRGAATAAGSAARYAGSAAAQTSLGVRVLKATESMRSRSSSAGQGTVTGSGGPSRPIPNPANWKD